MAVVDEPVPAGLWLEDNIELVLPARPDLLFLVRMTAGAVGTRAGLEADRVEDLRLAVDELLAKLLWDRTSDATVRITFEWGDGVVEAVASLADSPDDRSTPGVRGTAESVTDASTAEELSRCVLDALVDRHGFDETGPTPVSWLRISRAR